MYRADPSGAIPSGNHMMMLMETKNVKRQLEK